MPKMSLSYPATFEYNIYHHFAIVIISNTMNHVILFLLSPNHLSMTDSLPVHTGKYRPPKHLIPTISGCQTFKECSVWIGSFLFIINGAEDPPLPRAIFGTLVLRIHSARSTPASDPHHGPKSVYNANFCLQDEQKEGLDSFVDM